jgi:iron transport multicopper oxidase
MSRGTVNGTTYIPPIVPTLYTALTAPANLSIDPAIYGPNTNTVIFNNPLGITEIVVNNLDGGLHPFHIHGHIAQIVAVGAPGKKGAQVRFNGKYLTTPPTRRDVFMVEKYSYAVIRFKTGNPGIWLLHCHIEWHIEAGLVMTFVEDPIQLQAQNLTIPQNMYDACKAQGIPTIGNAGGDTKDWYNMKKVPKKPDPNPWG